MDCLNAFYRQYYILRDKKQEISKSELTVDLLQSDIKLDYYNQTNKTINQLICFYEKYLTIREIKKHTNKKSHDQCDMNMKSCLLIDVLRYYDGLNHSTSFNRPEGISLLVFIGIVLNIYKVHAYDQLKAVNSDMLSLINLIPYLYTYSEELGNTYSLFHSPIPKQYMPQVDHCYEQLLYKLYKKIAEMDDYITLQEQECLNEIALLNDDNPNNAIDTIG